MKFATGGRRRRKNGAAVVVPQAAEINTVQVDQSLLNRSGRDVRKDGAGDNVLEEASEFITSNLRADSSRIMRD